MFDASESQHFKVNQRLQKKLGQGILTEREGISTVDPFELISSVKVLSILEMYFYFLAEQAIITRLTIQSLPFYESIANQALSPTRWQYQSLV